MTTASFAENESRQQTEGIQIDCQYNSDILLIACGGISQGMGILPYEFSRITSDFKVKKIFLKDCLQNWYQNGIKLVGNNIDQIVDYLKSFIQKQDIQKVVVTGNSAGGYAAILFGYLLEADTAIAFSPQTFIDPKNRSIFGDHRWQSQLNKLYQSFNPETSNQYFDLLKLWQNKNTIKTQFYIYFCRENHLDTVHAARLQGCHNVTLQAYDGNEHNIVKTLRNIGILKPLLLTQLYPESAQLYYEQGLAYTKRNYLDKAIYSYLRAIEIEPNYLESYHRLGQLYLQQKKWEQAIAIYQQAIDFSTDNAFFFEQLGQIYLQQKSWSLAQQNYQKALEIDPQCTWLGYEQNRSYKIGQFYNHLGTSFEKQKKWNKAIEFYLQAIAIQPSIKSIYTKIRNIQKINPNQINQIINCYQQAQQKENIFPSEYYITIGDLLTRQEKFDEAAHYYRHACYTITSQSRPNFVEKHWSFQQSQGPNFLIIGAAKAGTTSLYHYLSQHPQILPAVKKEVGYFNRSDNLQPNLNWYLSHFPTIPEETNFITGEATPSYLISDVQEQVFALFPQIKLILVLRNPVERAISHYYHRLKHGWESNSLEIAINSELAMLKQLEHQEQIEQFCREKNSVYLLGGLYVHTIKRWLKIFAKEQLLILTNEQLLSEPEQTMKQIYIFLNLADNHNLQFKKHNVGSYNHQDEQLRENLSQFFISHNTQLEEYLGMKFNWV
ncbi:sulfotransferase [Stanieria cyanosphaera PCC 7437]|uniref:Sulfotransferase n=1 Tax=Stanieria cyanosphaera (strain ATCC 29371 / PCC 7437) TaxID=111780 RepID=K9XUH6_STAC7|nr:tetratricopeptide repeat protein [Stanieria cyanosphaera]AFZ36255.1 sulfotransferase [Stanieria cyanosphaera PCC 7437]